MRNEALDCQGMKCVVGEDGIARAVPLSEHDLAQQKIDAADWERVKVDRAWAELRQQRDALLAKTDYKMQPDYPISDAERASLQTYRQALRDLPENTTDPSNVSWPELK